MKKGRQSRIKVSQTTLIKRPSCGQTILQTIWLRRSSPKIENIDTSELPEILERYYSKLKKQKYSIEEDEDSDTYMNSTLKSINFNLN